MPRCVSSHASVTCAKRSRTPCEPKSGEQLDQIAPRLVAASIAMTVSGMLGVYATTRSPATTPSCASRAESCATRAYSSRYVITVSRLLVSARKTIAGWSSRKRSRFSAKLRRLPGKNLAPGILVGSSTTRSYGADAITPVYFQHWRHVAGMRESTRYYHSHCKQQQAHARTAAQKSSRCSTDHVQSSCGVASDSLVFTRHHQHPRHDITVATVPPKTHPCASFTNAVKRVQWDVASSSGVGVHTVRGVHFVSRRFMRGMMRCASRGTYADCWCCC